MKKYNSLDLAGGLLDSYSRWDLTELSISEEEYLEQVLSEEGLKLDTTKLGITAVLDTKQILEDWAKTAVDLLNSQNGRGVKIAFDCVYSPREYNYTTDSFDFTIEGLGGCKDDEEALAVLKDTAEALLEDEAFDLYEPYTEILRENITAWDWRGVEYETEADLAEDLKKFEKMIDHGADLADLPRPFVVELKQRYLTDDGESVSWEELSRAEELVSDEELAEKFGGVGFVAEDFVKSGDY